MFEKGSLAPAAAAAAAAAVVANVDIAMQPNKVAVDVLLALNEFRALLVFMMLLLMVVVMVLVFQWLSSCGHQHC